MVEKIDGRKIAEKIKDQIAKAIYQAEFGRPNLAIILVGEREDSKLYVSLKEREAVRVGIDTHVYKLSETIKEQELIEIIEFLNQDKAIDGILIQLPLPENFNTDKITSSIDPQKDVDGFHPNHPDFIISPVLAAVLASLDEVKCVNEDSSACVFYNSDVFGQTIQTALIKRGFNILPTEKSNEADVLISALGAPLSVTKEVIKEGSILIDIGTTKVEGKVLGDIDFLSVKNKASFITPVPGGIGPMTIAFLFKNVWEIFKRKKI